MRILKKSKDGGPESLVTGYFLIEIKPLFTIALLKFENGTREAYHSHAFNCISWLLWGRLDEKHKATGRTTVYWPSILPFMVYKTTFHQVYSYGNSWVLTFRGPWNKTWEEYLPDEDRHRTLTHGRKEV